MTTPYLQPEQNCNISSEGAFERERRHAIALTESLDHVYLFLSEDAGEFDRLFRVDVKTYLLNELRNTTKSFETILHELDNIEAEYNDTSSGWVVDFNTSRLVSPDEHDEEAEVFTAELCSPGTLEAEDVLLCVQEMAAIDSEVVYQCLCVNLAVALRLIDDSNEATQGLYDKIHDALSEDRTDISPYMLVEQCRKESFLQ